MSNFAKCRTPRAQSRLAEPSPRKRPEGALRHVIETIVTHTFIIAGTEFWGMTRGNPRAAFARQVGMYLAHVAFGLSFTEVGHLFARDRTTVAHACQLVEDRRDDRGFDRVIEQMESAAHLLRPSLAAPSLTSAALGGPSRKGHPPAKPALRKGGRAAPRPAQIAHFL